MKFEEQWKSQEQTDVLEQQDSWHDIITQYLAKKDSLLPIDFQAPLNPLHLQADYQILVEALKEANPNLYRYRTRQDLDSLFNAGFCKLREPTTYLEFVQEISKVFNTMACGHSSWSHSAAFQKYRRKEMRFFPLTIIALDQKFYLDQNYSASPNLDRGIEILSINGRSSSQIITKLRQHMYQDGHSSITGEPEISLYFPNAYSNFIAQEDSFELEVLGHDGSRETLTVAAETKAHIDSLQTLHNRRKPNFGIPLRFEIDGEANTAIYTIKWFRKEYMQSYNQDFESFTDSIFKEIKQQNIQNLIIDLRGNHGGWTAYGKFLFSYFIKEPQDFIFKVEFAKTDSFNFAPLIISDQGIVDSMQFQRNAEGLLEWSNYPNARVQPHPEASFDGNVYILLDEESRSCSMAFASMMRSHTNAKFAGGPAGAAQCGSGAMLMSFQLPYTGIGIHTSTAKYSFAVKNPHDAKGILIDYPAQATIEDLLEGRDRDMQMLRSMIRKEP